MKYYFVYILASRHNGVLYTGISRNLIKEHINIKVEPFPDFQKKYNAKILVWYEIHYDIYAAIKREKQIKKWKREWKINLIEKDNSDWKDLYGTLL